MTIFQFITRDVFERERDLRISQRREFGLRHRERERENVSERERERGLNKVSFVDRKTEEHATFIHCHTCEASEGVR